MTILNNKLLSLALLLFVTFSPAQTQNYIANGSFEERYNCNLPFTVPKAKSWLSIDSISIAGLYMSDCNSSVPINGNTFQYPKTGKSYVATTFYCLLQDCGRGYLKNRLKQNLQAGKTYCAKFHVNICNTSPRGIDGFGMYFGDSSIDTITYCNIPLTFINPQVKNSIGNPITDTLNWVAITGTFVASGNEKYALIGNFLANNAVTTGSIGGPFYPDVGSSRVDLQACKLEYSIVSPK